MRNFDDIGLTTPMSFAEPKKIFGFDLEFWKWVYGQIFESFGFVLIGPRSYTARI